MLLECQVRLHRRSRSLRSNERVRNYVQSTRIDLERVRVAHSHDLSP